MSDLKDRIRADLTTAMKAKDAQRTGTLRMLLAALQAEETSGRKHELDDATIIRIIAREIKTRTESAAVYADNGREDLAAQERAEIAVLQDYQPKQLDDAALHDLVTTAVAEVAEQLGERPTTRQMGQIMKLAQERAAGRADGKRLSNAVKAALE